MDHYPEDIDAYVETSKRIEALTEFSQDPEVQKLILAWGASTVKMLWFIEDSGRFSSRTEICAAFGGMAGQVIAEWVAGNLEKPTDG